MKVGDERGGSQIERWKWQRQLTIQCPEAQQQRDKTRPIRRKGKGRGKKGDGGDGGGDDGDDDRSGGGMGGTDECMRCGGDGCGYGGLAAEPWVSPY